MDIQTLDSGLKYSYVVWQIRKGNNVVNSGNSGGYAAKVENKSVGLMYISDYLYASGHYSNLDTSTAYQSYFGKQNWLNNGSIEWTITSYSSNDNYVFSVIMGIVKIDTTYAPSVTPSVIRPTFYLKSQVYVTGGDGTFHNPYTIACDTCS